jgi:hypothetical protein
MPHLTNFGLFNKNWTIQQKLDFRDAQMIIKGSCRDFSERHEIKAYMEFNHLWWEIP